VATVPTTHTVAVGDKITAADENTYVRDATAFQIAPPRLFVYQGTTGTTAGTSGTAALMLWDSEQWDTDSMHSTSTNTSRLNVVTSGLYDVKASVFWAANATGFRELEIRKNSAGAVGSGTGIFKFRVPATATLGGWVGGSGEVSLVAGDYLECFALQTSGGSLATTVGAQFTWCSMRWVATS
jgi:hypothetical protein